MTAVIVGGALLHVVLGGVCGRRMLRPWPWWACFLAGGVMIVIAIATFYIVVFTTLILLGAYR